MQLPYAAPVMRQQEHRVQPRPRRARKRARGAHVRAPFGVRTARPKLLFGRAWLAAVPLRGVLPGRVAERPPAAAEACANVGHHRVPNLGHAGRRETRGDKALKELAAAAGFRAPPEEAADAAAQLDDLLG